MNGGTVGNSLIGVDRLVGFFAVEEVADELLDTRDTGGATDEDNFIDRLFIDLSVAEDIFDGIHGGAEEILTQLFKSSTGDAGVEVDTLEERIDLDAGLRRGGQSTLSTLACGAETTEGTGVGREIFLVLALELLDEMVDESVVEILTTQMCVTGGGFDFEDALFDGQERDIKGTSSEIENEDVLLADGLLVETIGDGGGGRLVDDTEDVEAGNQTSVLGGLALRVVEVGGDSDDGVVDGSAEVGLCSLTHLGENHRRDFLRGEGLFFALVLDLDDGLAALVENLEWPVLHVGLHLSIGESTADKTFGVKDSVVRVHGDLIFGGITNETLRVGEGNVRRGGSVALVVGDDFNTIVLPDSNATVGRSEIDTDGFA